MKNRWKPVTLALLSLLLLSGIAKAAEEFAVQIVAADEHALALCKSGRVLGWGSNGFGECEPPRDLHAVANPFACSEVTFHFPATAYLSRELKVPTGKGTWEYTSKEKGKPEARNGTGGQDGG